MRNRLLVAMVWGAMFVPTDSVKAADCFADFRSCLRVARSHDAFLDRFVGVADCELNVAECVRKKLVGV